MSRVVDMTNKRFGRLTVIERDLSIIGKAYWKCLCDCGKETIVYGASLRNGLTKSCGCLSNEISKNNFKKHGLSNTRLYRIYYSMKNRCYKHKDKRYENYGKRGIIVCDEWKNSFEAFYEWAMRSGYNENLTIERIDVNGDYCPDNCTWITKERQSLNKTNSYLITYNGETKCLSEWARQFGISRGAILNRIKRGWNIEKALTKKIDKSGGNNNE